MYSKEDVKYILNTKKSKLTKNQEHFTDEEIELLISKIDQREETILKVKALLAVVIVFIVGVYL